MSQVNTPASTVLTNLGAAFEYYDTSTRQLLYGFPRIYSQLTLQHYCSGAIPRSLKAVLPHMPHLPIIGDHIISSYQIQANREQWLRGFPRISSQLTLQYLRGVAIPRSLKAVVPHTAYPPITGDHIIPSY
ncbi:hypothetical protein KVT40_002907 [Elsinoe batatas]|uniref:Uncharacterized protein n=1 Tax=Elsinoe batatas TaxID=2601811 RepID=A0A8K0PHZ9_9PEZI|nr:hypothetical protein KVT40_002907 [Elsinoe batatas]